MITKIIPRYSKTSTMHRIKWPLSFPNNFNLPSVKPSAARGVLTGQKPETLVNPQIACIYGHLSSKWYSRF